MRASLSENDRIDRMIDVAHDQLNGGATESQTLAAMTSLNRSWGREAMTDDTPGVVLKTVLDRREEMGLTPPPPEPAKTAGLKLKRAASVNPEPVRWLWPGVAARGVITVLDGDPGLGKSTLTGYMAATGSVGGRWPDGTRSETFNTIMVNLEDDLARTLRPRLDAAGANLNNVLLFDGDNDGFTMPNDLDRLEAAIVEHRAGLVVIDPLMAVLDGKINSYRDQDIRRVMSRLKAVCSRTDCAVVVVRHLNKSVGGNAITRGGGSIGIVGAARVGLLLARDPQNDDQRILATIKNNLVEYDPHDSIVWRIADGPRLEYVGQSSLSADDLVQPQSNNGPGRPDDRRTDATAWLCNVLSDGPVQSADLKARAEDAGFSWRTVERTRKAVAETYRVGVSWWVRLKDDSQDRQNYSQDRQYPINSELWRPYPETVDNTPKNLDFQDRQNYPSNSRPPKLETIENCGGLRDVEVI